MLSGNVLMKKRHPGGTSLGYYWENEDSIVEVDQFDAPVLERASHGDIYRVADAPEPEPEPYVAPIDVNDIAPDDEIASPGDTSQSDLAQATTSVTAPRKTTRAKKAAPPKLDPLATAPE